MMKDWIEQSDISECRLNYEWLHAHPEEGGQEYQTSAYVQNTLSERGYSIFRASETGFIAFLDLGFREAVALRAELDALSMDAEEESGDICHETRHACGHDGHMAILMAVGKILVRNKEQLKTNIALLFEEGEEKGIGNSPLREVMKPLGIKSVWGLHVEPEVESGRIALMPGVIMAGDTDVEIRIVGEGGHASRPDLCKNPIYVATEVVQALRTMWMEETKPGAKITFGLTKFLGGKELNVIPEEVILGGSLRFFDKEIARDILARMKKKIIGIVSLHGCKVQFSESMDILGDITWNDENLCEKVRDVMVEQGLGEAIIKIPPLYSSESFAHFCNEYPSIYAFLGNRKGEENVPLHSRDFQVDTNNFKLGIQAALCYIQAESMRKEHDQN